MDTQDAKLERLRKRLSDTQSELQAKTEGYARVEALIRDLEKIKADWAKALADVKKEGQEYRELIKELKKGRRRNGLFRF